MRAGGRPFLAGDVRKREQLARQCLQNRHRLDRIGAKSGGRYVRRLHDLRRRRRRLRPDANRRPAGVEPPDRDGLDRRRRGFGLWSRRNRVAAAKTSGWNLPPLEKRACRAHTGKNRCVQTRQFTRTPQSSRRRARGRSRSSHGHESAPYPGGRPGESSTGLPRSRSRLACASRPGRISSSPRRSRRCLLPVASRSTRTGPAPAS